MKKSYMEYAVEETQKLLAIDSPSGYTGKVAEYLMKEYTKLGYEPVQTVKGGVLVKLGGKDEKNAILLEAHGDTLGAMVCERKGNGRLKVTPLGGMNPNNAETENCRIVTKSGKVYTGTCSVSIHFFTSLHSASSSSIVRIYSIGPSSVWKFVDTATSGCCRYCITFRALRKFRNRPFLCFEGKTRFR